MSKDKSKTEQVNEDLLEVPGEIPVETLGLLVENGVGVLIGQEDDMSVVYVAGFEGIIKDEIYHDLIDSIFGKGVGKLAESKGVSLESLIEDLLTFWIIFNRINLDLYRIQKR